MAMSNYVMDFKVKYPKLLLIINTPVVLLGFKPVVPKCFISVSKPRAIKCH